MNEGSLYSLRRITGRDSLHLVRGVWMPEFDFRFFVSQRSAGDP